MVRATETEELIGFAWVDAAPAADYGIEEPWWCMNAIAVAPEHRRNRVGARLVNLIVNQAREIGVTLLYGLSVEAAVPFWRSFGLTIADADEPLISNAPVSVADGTRRTVTFDVEPGHRMFVGYLSDPAAGGPVLLPGSQRPS